MPSFTSARERANRVNVCGPADRIRAQIEQEITAAIAETIGCCAGRANQSWCWYCGAEFRIGRGQGAKKRGTLYCSGACGKAARRAGRKPV